MFPVEQLFLGNLHHQSLQERWRQVINHHSVNELKYVEHLKGVINISKQQRNTAEQQALRWVNAIRDQQLNSSLEPLLQEFKLDTPEGLALMTLAEALIRIPDGPTADALIRDRLQSADWNPHQEIPHSTWINLSGWALSHAKRWFDEDSEQKQSIVNLVHKLGDPLLRAAIQQAIKLIANQYILGENIYEALDRSQIPMNSGSTYSFDMLGEAALQDADAATFQAEYLKAIEAVGLNESYPEGVIRPSISIKLSALHPRFEATGGESMICELEDRLIPLISKAIDLNVPLTIDAEETDRLEPTLQIFEHLIGGIAQSWGFLGIAVQTYSKRAIPVLHWLEGLGEQHSITIPVRLVKGAYWDTEVKLSQQRGDQDYPVFTRKASTDISYLCCAEYLFSEFNNCLSPQFATHNALTLSQLVTFHPDEQFECQRLQGMGKQLHQLFAAETHRYSRIYAPVGKHRELLPYLIRRLLENGANSSFVNQLANLSVDAKELVLDPQEHWENQQEQDLPSPPNIFATRKNSTGMNLQLTQQQTELLFSTKPYQHQYYFAAPLINGEAVVQDNLEPLVLYSPTDINSSIGELYLATNDEVDLAFEVVAKGQPAWASLAVKSRAFIIEQYADLLESHSPELIQLSIREGGKTLPDAIAEIREAVDFCRYYAEQANLLQGQQHTLPAITGERNTLCYSAKGIFLCISPWNFPIAIFTGQIVAALVTGNSVIAKPSLATPLIAYRCIQLLIEAGVPADVIALLPGQGNAIGKALCQGEQLSGVAFTGSTDTAQTLQQSLASRLHPKIVRLIAETGGQNAMIADSSTLVDQLVRDAMASAFTSAGQRCSALRVLYIQEEIYAETVKLLKGAMARLIVGPPGNLTTDVGPVISESAYHQLNIHLAKCEQNNQLLYQTPIPEMLPPGNYIAPSLVELSSITELKQEHFGPILHVIVYASNEIDTVIDKINQSGYGLTFGIHSRNETFIDYLYQRIKAGNIYINRNQVGATVGCQPFGGIGLSGTGPKAGGPNYLRAFTYEKTKTVNTTAWGGNISLLSGLNHKKK